ncbi:MAG TPA: hypothetical protein VHG92_12330 [Afifellaceae bacterium]|nr:hypothetical protein [Afifellaceae bacterium]
MTRLMNSAAVVGLAFAFAGPAAGQEGTVFGDASLRPMDITCQDLLAATPEEQAGLVYFIAGYQAGFPGQQGAGQAGQMNAGQSAAATDVSGGQQGATADAAGGTNQAAETAATPAMNEAVGDVAASEQDVQAQNAGQPTAAEQASDAAAGATTETAAADAAAAGASGTGAAATGTDTAAATGGTTGTDTGAAATGTDTAAATGGTTGTGSAGEPATTGSTGAGAGGDVMVARTFFSTPLDQILQACQGSATGSVADVVRGIQGGSK